MAQYFAETVTNARCAIMAFCRNTSNGKPTGNILFYMEDMTHEHIDQDKQKENQLRRLLLFAGEDKQEQPTTIAILRTSSILRQRLRCTKSPKKGIITNILSYKEAGRHLANTTIKA